MSERLASLGIMWAQLRAPLKTLNTTVLWCTGGFQGALNWAPWHRETPDSRTADRCFFFQSGCSGRCERNLFLDLVESHLIWILITILWTNNDKYNANYVLFNKKQKQKSLFAHRCFCFLFLHMSMVHWKQFTIINDTFKNESLAS